MKSKGEVIEEGLTDPSEIQDAVNDAAEKYNITLTQEQMDKITALMESISQYDYDVKAFRKHWITWPEKKKASSQKSGNPSKAYSLAVLMTAVLSTAPTMMPLGADAIIDSTLDSVKDAANEAKEEGFWDKVVNFFKTSSAETTQTKRKMQNLRM